MQAVVNYDEKPFSVELREKPIPIIGDDDVLLRVRGVGVCGSDLHQWHASQSWEVRYPVTLGHEFAGEIISIGKRVTNFQIGERVVSETAAYICGECIYCRSGNYNLCPKRMGFGYGLDGAMADFVRTPGRCIHRLPDNVSFEDAAMTEPACVACNAVVELSQIQPGDTVVVMGPGTIGLMATQVSRLQNPGTLVLIGTSRDAERLKLGRELGADLTLQADTDDIVALVKTLGDGLGAHLVVDCVGRSAALKPCLEMVRPMGQITRVGWGAEPLGFSLDPMIGKAVRLQGSFSHNFKTWERVIGWIASNRLQLSKMRRTFPLNHWLEAFQIMDSLVTAKSVLIPAE